MRQINPFLLPLFRSVLFIIVGLLFAWLTNQSLEQASRWWSILCTIVNLITIALLIVICKKEGTSYKKLIASPKGEGNGVKFTLFIVLIMVLLGTSGMYGFGLLVYGYVPVTMVQPIPVWLAAVNLILLPITVVFAELPLYFGYALTRIEEITGNKLLALGYPIFFYALQHSFIPLANDWEHILYRFLSYIPILLVIGMIYYRQRNLKPLMIGHGVLDLATGIQILVVSISPALFEIMNTA